MSMFLYSQYRHKSIQPSDIQFAEKAAYLHPRPTYTNLKRTQMPQLLAFAFASTHHRWRQHHDVAKDGCR